jgi:hypothetical protein
MVGNGRADIGQEDHPALKRGTDDRQLPCEVYWGIVNHDVVKRGGGSVRMRALWHTIRCLPHAIRRSCDFRWRDVRARLEGATATLKLLQFMLSE